MGIVALLIITYSCPQYRCIAMDHLGLRLSDKPRDWSCLPQDHADNLIALIEALGFKNITLVVQDWGGPIGLSCAVTHPENVASIVIMNSWARPVNRDSYYKDIALRENELKKWERIFPEARTLR
ncbi:MAG: alpha/beta fold hydrolase [Thermodesulfobacteriota bacterium]